MSQHSDATTEADLAKLFDRAIATARAYRCRNADVADAVMAITVDFVAAGLSKEEVMRYGAPIVLSVWNEARA